MHGRLTLDDASQLLRLAFQRHRQNPARILYVLWLSHLKLRPGSLLLLDVQDEGLANYRYAVDDETALLQSSGE